MRAKGSGPIGGRRAGVSAAAAAALTLAGCTTVREEASWTYGTSETRLAAPRALYGLPETSAYLVLECLPPARAIAFRTVEPDLFEGTRPIRIRVGQVRFDGSEQLEPDDGMAISRALIPLDAPIVAALAAGQGPIAVTVNRRTGRIPNGPALARMVRECRAMAGQG